MLNRPVVSEKSLKLAQNGLYTFDVSREASKDEVAKLIAKKFKVEVVSIKSMNTKAKTKLQRNRRGYYQISPKKKMIVELKKGQKLALFEQITQEEENVEVTRGEEVTEVKETKSRLKGTKVKIEKVSADKKEGKTS